MSIKIKPICFLFFALPVLCFLFYAGGTVCAEDKIIAIVNEDVITQKDLLDFLGFMRLQMSEQYKGRELEEKLGAMKRDILNRLIDDKLVLQEARKNNIAVDSSRVRARIEQVKKEYSSEAVFQAELMKQGVTQGDVEKRIREQFMSFGVIDQKIRSKIIVKPEEITQFYQDNKKLFNTGEGKEFQAISFENEDLASAVSYGLKSKVRLEELAARYPLTVNKLIVRRTDELRKEIQNVVSSLSIDEVSSPVRMGSKYYVFKLLNIIPSHALTLSESQDKIRAILFDQKLQAAMAEWLKELKRNSYIKVMND